MVKKIGLSLFGFVVLLSLGYAIYACPEKRPEWISATAAVVSALGVIFIWQQLQETKKIAQLQFQDGLAKEYRELISRIPTKAMLGEYLPPKEFVAAFDELFRYIDLSNEQVMLRKHKRISVEVWTSWCSGITFNFALPAFQQAWKKVQQKTPTQFSELKQLFDKLENTEIDSDPALWNKN
jgi:hypothetical protein